MIKIYCSECKYIENCVECWHPSKITKEDCYYCIREIPGKASKINEHNNCELFQEAPF
jgi:hypothetical protein